MKHGNRASRSSPFACVSTVDRMQAEKKMISHKKILILSSATHSLLFFSRSLLARHFTITTADKTEKWFSTQRQSLPKNTHKWHISYHDAHTKYMYIYIPRASRNITKLEILNYSIRGLVCGNNVMWIRRRNGATHSHSVHSHPSGTYSFSSTSSMGKSCVFYYFFCWLHESIGRCTSFCCCSLRIRRFYSILLSALRMHWSRITK